jgi:predicted amidohydrolase
MTRAISIATAAYPLSQFSTLGAYKDKLASWVAEAVARRAELLVFPEYGAMEYAAATGAAGSDLQASLAAVASVMPAMDAVHADLARRHRVHILASSGPCPRAPGRIVNAARLFAPSGAMGVQDKLMMTPFERDWGVAPGDGLQVFETDIGRIGIAICYDSEFPLLVRAQAEAGADIILIPSCTEFVSGFHRVRTAALARALENGCVTVQSPTVGDAPWSPAVDYNSGAAGVFVPSERGLSDTGVLAVGVLNAPGWVTATVDLERLRHVRTSGEMRNALDWPQQPGAAVIRPAATVVSLI